MAGRYLSVAVWFSAAFLLKESSAAITPLDKTYTIASDGNINIPWTYDNAASMSQVFWTYKSSASATATTIMSKVGTASAQVFNSFNVIHFTSGVNGEIELQKVTMDNNQGVYYCQVSYALGSNLPTVTGTATLFVTAATTTTSTISTTTSTTTTTTTPANTTATTPTNTMTTPGSTTTTMPITTTSMRMPITTSTPPITSSTLTSNSTSSTVSSNEGLSDEMIIVIVIVPVGLIAFVGTVIFFCLFYRLQRGKRKPASHESHKQRKHYKGNMRSVQQQQQQQPYILYGRGHPRQSNHKETKRSRSLHNDDRYNWYDGYHWGTQVKQNPVYKGDRNLDRLYYNKTLPRYDDYRSGYITGHVYPSHTNRYHYRPDYHGNSKGYGNSQHSLYPVYSTQQEYIDHSYLYMGY